MKMGRYLGFILCLLVALSSCDSNDPGSGGGIGGSGIRPVLATGASLGSISEFGSIVLNGARFDTDDATFFVNNTPISQSDLRIGMNVLAAVNFSSSIASQVDYVPSLIGPVESVTLTDKTFRSLGQTVRLSVDTSYENLSLPELAAGMVVEVSGLRDATGTILATFIRPALDATRYQLVGTILSNLGDSEQFLLNGLQINIAQANLSQISADEMEFGDKVYVTASSSAYDPIQASMNADSVRVALEPMVSAGERVEYEGIISTFGSPFEFDVYWQPVTANNQTRVEYEDGTLADLSMMMLNTRLEIEAIVQGDGVYQASKITLISTENSNLTGVIERLIPDTSSFTVLGLNIQVTERTRYGGSSDDSEGQDQDIASFSELSVGDYVEVDAAFLGNRLVASRVEVDDPDERAILKGPVNALVMTPERIDIINQSILLGVETSYESRNGDEISREAFIEQLQVGMVVKARWDEFQSIALPPDSIEVE